MTASNTYGRQVVLPLTNKSGGSVAAGDVVVIDTANNDAFTTTTTGQAQVSVGVAQETIANNAAGRVLVAGYTALLNVPASVTRGHYIETHTVAKQATGNATRRAGSFGQFATGGASPTGWLWGSTDQTTTGGSGTDNWHADINPMIDVVDSTTAGTWVLFGGTDGGVTYPFANDRFSVLFSSSMAQNDRVDWKVGLSSGTWDCTIAFRKMTICGIITLLIDGSSAGTIDTYAAAPAYGTGTLSGISIGSSGAHTIGIKMATKNASATNYAVELFWINLRRTA